MKTDEIIKAIREQQIECSKYVYITILTEEEIKKLLLEGNYFYTQKDDKILAALYVKSLSKKDKIYRLGGFTVLNIKNPSFIIKKEALKLLTKLKQYIFNHNISFILEINAISIGNFFINLGAKKLSFKECLEQHLLFLKLYMDNATEDREYFKTKTFYVKEVSVSDYLDNNDQLHRQVYLFGARIC